MILCTTLMTKYRRSMILIVDKIHSYFSLHRFLQNEFQILSSSRFDQVVALIVVQMYVEIWSKFQVSVKIYIAIWTFASQKQHDHHLRLIRRISSDNTIQAVTCNQWHIYTDLLPHVTKLHEILPSNNRRYKQMPWIHQYMGLNMTLQQHDFLPWRIYPD